MIQSGGALVLAETTPTFARVSYVNPGGVNLVNDFATYSALYRAQIWVYSVVNKLAWGTARLPLKVYRRTPDGREPARDEPYARLLRDANPHLDPFALWLWTVSTLNIYGEAIWAKVRGRDGLPAQLWPLHPRNCLVRLEDGELTYYFYAGSVGSPAVPQFSIPAADIVHFRFYNPDSTIRGLSPLEPLRQTLANEDAARRATSSFWKRGARPSVALSHPKKLSKEAAQRLRDNWDAVHAGADNMGGTAVLEEGMKPEVLSLNLEEAQYIETRKLNREEVCGGYDIPPPVVHILDRATFSNITEQMRSLYRDTMAPKLGFLESVLDQQLRPDFSTDDSLYAEFLLDEVLRGAFETRADAYQKAINSGWMKPAEVRAAENMPAAEGADRLFVNATLIPIDEVSSRTSPNPPAEDLGLPDVPAVSELAPGTAPVPTSAGNSSPPPIGARSLRTLMGRLGNLKSVESVSIRALTDGLNGEAEIITAEWLRAVADGASIVDFRARLKAMAEE